MLKQVLVLLLLATAVLAETAYFTAITIGDRVEFIVKITDDGLIKHARDLVSGETTDKPHLMGRIKKSPASYNPRFSYHIDPNTISFFNHAIEVCDASFSYVEDNLDEAGGAFLPGYYFCPWTSQLVRELKVDEFHDYQRSFRTGGRYWSNDRICS